MAQIPTGLCWSRHLADPLQPYKVCQGMHLSIEGRKQEARRLQRGDKFKGNAAFFYLPKSVGQLIALPCYSFLGQTLCGVKAAELFPISQTCI